MAGKKTEIITFSPDARQIGIILQHSQKNIAPNYSLKIRNNVHMTIPMDTDTVLPLFLLQKKIILFTQTHLFPI